MEVVGDLDRDGAPDVAVAAPGASPNGKVFVFSSATGALVRAFGSAQAQPADGQFGSAIVPAGDVDGDGTPDLLVGAPAERGRGDVRAGRVYLLSGATAEPLLVLISAHPAAGTWSRGLADAGGPGGGVACPLLQPAMRFQFALVLAALLVTGTTGGPSGGPGSSRVASGPPPAVSGARWGEFGHRLIGRAAADALPDSMPPFFRAAAAQLAYLNPDPDRWRARSERALDPALEAAGAPEHYIDMELLPAGALLARDRLGYADSLRTAGLATSRVGLLPYRTLELAQRLRIGFRQWRAATNPDERAWIEARIINDAGVLGHYVADGSNPHHTTVHHDGWVGENPQGFTTERGFHGRFEGQYVASHIELADVQRAAGAPARDLGDLRTAVWAYLGQTHTHVEALYALDRAEPFGRDTAGPAHEAFAAERLGAGAEMLRDLWWTAWVSSASAE